MSDQPNAISERFTIYRDVNNRPVERRLSDMMAAEVLAALRWQSETVAHLRMAAESAQQMIEVKQARIDTEDLAVLVFRELAAEEAREAHLHNLIFSAMPQWKQHPEVCLLEAVRRFWQRSSSTVDFGLDRATG
jgi:hypothetical protein